MHVKQNVVCFFCKKECQWLQTTNDETYGSTVILHCPICNEYKTKHHLVMTANTLSHISGQKIKLSIKETGEELNKLKLKLSKHENAGIHVRAHFTNSQLKLREKMVLQKIASTALFCIVNAMSDIHFEKEICHLHFLGVDIGDSGHSRKLMARWKDIAWRLVTSLVSKILRTPSSSTNCWGIRFIGLSIDKYSISYGSFEIICIRTLNKGFMKGFPIAIVPCEYDNNELQVSLYFCACMSLYMFDDTLYKTYVFLIVFLGNFTNNNCEND